MRRLIFYVLVAIFISGGLNAYGADCSLQQQKLATDQAKIATIKKIYMVALQRIIALDEADLKQCLAQPVPIITPSPKPTPHPPWPFVGGFGWFFPIQSPAGDTPTRFYVGPYVTRAQCQDMFGSAIYSHPFACHEGWSPSNCAITGNGFAYPLHYPYPVPESMDLTADQSCVLMPLTVDNTRNGNVFIFYGPNGTSGMRACSQWHDSKLLVDTPNSPYLMGNYVDMQCPGAPCFSIASDTACN